MQQSHLAVGGLVGGAGVVVFLLKVGAGLRVKTTWVGWAALGLVYHGQGMWDYNNLEYALRCRRRWHVGLVYHGQRMWDYNNLTHAL